MSSNPVRSNPVSAKSGSDAAIIVRDLRKRFRRVAALDGVDLSVPRGSIYGLVGLNGAGKTTTIAACLGLLSYESGNIEVLGQPPARLARLGSRVAAVFDTPCLHPRLSVKAELEHGFLRCGRQGRTPAEVLEMLDLVALADRRCQRLSLGNRRRTSIALALLGQPELVILDEPFAGLDARGVDDLLELLQLIQREHGTTFLLSSHQLDLLERVCSHIGFLHQGRVLREGPTGPLLADVDTYFDLKVSPVGCAQDLLMEQFQLPSTLGPDGIIQIAVDGHDPAAINEALVREGIRVTELRRRSPGLSQLFRSLLEQCP